LPDTWQGAKIRELMKFLDNEVAKTADGMFRSERARRTASYINMWKELIRQIEVKKLDIERMESTAKTYEDNIDYWLGQQK